MTTRCNECFKSYRPDEMVSPETACKLTNGLITNWICNQCFYDGAIDLLEEGVLVPKMEDKSICSEEIVIINVVCPLEEKLMEIAANLKKKS